MRPIWVQCTWWTLPGVFLAASCYPPQSERLTCDDVYDSDEVDFRTIQALVRDENKGCLDGPCHSAETQQEGLQLDTPDLVYDEFSTRADQMYGILASGEMPEEGTRWSEDDLKALRSWYCSGGFPP